MATRVYHPTLNSWQDVETKDVHRWIKGGWEKDRPKHVDDRESLPVEPDPKPERAPVVVKPAEPKPAKG